MQEALDETLTGSIELMMDTLSLINPVAFGRARNLRRHVCATANRLGYQNNWSFEVAALLSQLGCITLPEELLGKISRGEKVSEEEQRLINNHPLVAKRLVGKIPKLEEAAEIIALQNIEVEEAGDGIESDSRIQRGASLLRMALQMEKKVFEDEAGLQDTEAKEVPLHKLRAGMKLNNDIRTLTGMLLMRAGAEVTEMLIERLKGFEKSSKLNMKTFKVIIPRKELGG